MMNTKEELKLSSRYKLITYSYDTFCDVYLECLDGYSSDSFSNDIEIKKENALEIIEFLKKSFQL